MSIVRHTSSTSTVIVGQHTLRREGLAALLQHSPYKVIESVGRASDLKEVRVASDRQPLAVLTIDETVGGPAEAAENIRTLRERFTRPTIVVVGETRNPVDVQKITALAANAYIADLTSRELLLKVLDLSAFAQPVLILPSSGTTASPSAPLAQPEPLAGRGGNGDGITNALDGARNGEGPVFSQRERQILCQLARGSSNKEIARVFCITESTVKVHLKALLRKIGARNRTQAAIWAVDRGYLISSPSAQSPPTQHAEHSPRLNVN
jgi:two-component system, NarL family, nitrate/nitrite response regulator NarL